MSSPPAYRRMLLIVITATVTASTSWSVALNLYVAPNGNDEWTGRSGQVNATGTDGPLATLAGARNALRQARVKGLIAEPVHIIIADGRYALSGPLVLLPEDSGTAQAAVHYEAAPGARPVFSGGRVITDFRTYKDGLWRAFIPEVASGKWYFEQLFVNGKRALRARTPNTFWFSVVDVSEETLDASGKEDTKQARHRLVMSPQDFRFVANLTARELKDVNLVVYHKWDTTRRFIHSLHTAESVIETRGKSFKPWNPWSGNSTFVLENFLSALDTPGEWFLARDGYLYYKPRPGEHTDAIEVIAPMVGTFIVLKGNTSDEKYVEHVQFDGLSFHHAQWLTPEQGFEPSQAAATIDAVVMADGARHIEFSNCEIGHVGTYAMWFRKGCRDNVVQHCHLFDFGAGGIRIGDSTPASRECESTQRIRVDNNIVRHGGFIFPCAVGIWIGFSSDNQITHNEIADLFYTGISVGWRWGYRESSCKRNRISNNHIHHLGWGLLSDMGGIYTLGPSEGSVVSGNVFHDIEAYAYGGWGMYTDEGSTGILFENNLVYNTHTGSFHQHYGKDNVVRNNLLVNSRKHQIQATRPEPHRSFTFEKNIIYWATGPALAGPWDKLNVASQSNCWWNHAGEKIAFAGKTLSEWQRLGHERGSVATDPKFVDPARHDFRLMPDSPALTLGFTPFDYTKAGVYGDAEWLNKANAETYPPLARPPAPKP